MAKKGRSLNFGSTSICANNEVFAEFLVTDWDKVEDDEVDDKVDQEPADKEADEEKVDKTVEPETMTIDKFAIIDSDEFVNCFARDNDNHSTLLFGKVSRVINAKA